MSNEDKWKIVAGVIGFLLVTGIIYIIVYAVTNVLEALNQRPFVYGLVIGVVAGGVFSYFGIPAITRLVKWIMSLRIEIKSEQ